jgi:uncharacterized protein YhaN
MCGNAQARVGELTAELERMEASEKQAAHEAKLSELLDAHERQVSQVSMQFKTNVADKCRPEERRAKRLRQQLQDAQERLRTVVGRNP